MSSEYNLFRYEKCILCDGRGLIFVQDLNNLESTQPCPGCLGSGTLKIYVDKNEL